MFVKTFVLRCGTGAQCTLLL